MKKFIIGVISAIIWGVAAINMWYGFKSGCEDYLKLAGDAPSIEKADQFLGNALDYLERNHLTSGNAAIFFHTPDADVGIWYGQIKGAKETTSNLLERARKGETVTQLERDNALMKIREVVLDQSKSGTTVTMPAQIAWFPSQLLMFLWLIVSSGLILYGIKDA